MGEVRWDWDLGRWREFGVGQWGKQGLGKRGSGKMVERSWVVFGCGGEEVEGWWREETG